MCERVKPKAGTPWGPTRLWLLSALLCLFWSAHYAHATSLIVITTDDGYWVGADSARNFWHNPTSTVCKVHETKFGLLLKSGQSQAKAADGQVYSVDKEIEQMVEASSSEQEFKNRAESQFQQDVLAQFVFDANTGNPNITASNISDVPFHNAIPPQYTEYESRLLLLIPTAPQEPKPTFYVIYPQSVEHRDASWSEPSYHYTYFTTDWTRIDSVPPEFRTADRVFTYPASVREFGVPVTYEKPDAWVRQNPQQALEEMLTLNHAQNGNNVAPPWVIVHVLLYTRSKRGQVLPLKKPKVEWKSKGLCPSWADAVVDEDAPW